MKEYETIVCVPSKLDEAAAEKEIQDIQDVITSNGGEIVLIDRWGKRRLAYAVNDQTDGVYTLIRHVANNDALLELERRFRINENMLRNLTIVADTPRPEPVVEAPPEEETETTETTETPAEEPATPAPEAAAPVAAETPEAETSN